MSRGAQPHAARGGRGQALLAPWHTPSLQQPNQAHVPSHGVHPIISPAQGQLTCQLYPHYCGNSLAWHSEILGDALLMERGGGKKAGGARRVNSLGNGFIFLLQDKFNNTYQLF